MCFLSIIFHQEVMTSMNFICLRNLFPVTICIQVHTNIFSNYTLGIKQWHVKKDVVIPMIFMLSRLHTNCIVSYIMNLSREGYLSSMRWLGNLMWELGSEDFV